MYHVGIQEYLKCIMLVFPEYLKCIMPVFQTILGIFEMYHVGILGIIEMFHAGISGIFEKYHVNISFLGKFEMYYVVLGRSSIVYLSDSDKSITKLAIDNNRKR